MLIETLSMAFRIAGTANSTGTSFTSLVPTTTEPTGDFVFTPSRNDVLVVPTGTANNETYDMRITGWSRVTGGDDEVWVPCMIDQYAVTVGNTGGVSGNTVFSDAVKLADTLTPSTATPGDSVRRYSTPGSDLVGFAVASRNAFERIQFSFAGSGHANALYAEL